MMLYLAIGSAAEDRISRMAQAMINSSNVIPASEENGLLAILPPIRPWYEVSRNIARTIPLRLDLQRGLAGDQRDQLLLRIFRIHLHDRQVRGARCERLDHDTDQRTAAAHSRCIGLSGCRNNGLAVLLVYAL